MLELGSMVETDGVAGLHVSLACDYCTIFLPKLVKLGAVRIFADHVNVQPFKGSTSLVMVGSERVAGSLIECGAGRSLVVRSVSFRSDVAL
eukprot:1926267-Rhodomonas_salina.1